MIKLFAIFSAVAIASNCVGMRVFSKAESIAAGMKSVNISEGLVPDRVEKISVSDAAENMDSEQFTAQADTIGIDNFYELTAMGAGYYYRFYYVGAGASIGFKDTVFVGSAKTFTDVLFTSLSQGKILSGAASDVANAILLPFDAAKDYRIVGNSSATLINAQVKPKSFPLSVNQKLSRAIS